MLFKTYKPVITDCWHVKGLAKLAVLTIFFLAKGLVFNKN